jgi:DNA-binding NtrC family response regulator
MSQGHNRILIVDDEKAYVEAMVCLLQGEGYEVEATESFEQTVAKAESFLPDLIILDLTLPGGENEGVAILERLRKRWSPEALPILVVTGFGNPQRVMDVLGRGANDYIDKPLEVDSLLEKLRRFLAARPDKGEPVKAAVLNEIWHEHLVGHSPIINNLAKTIFQKAHSECDVLFLGETGNGKNLLAKIFHQVSPRNDKPFVTIELNGIPEGLFETTLFGNRKNAFSGAGDADFAGAAEKAQGGILFLDEIGDVPVEQQGKLLRLVEEKTITPVGSAKSIELDLVILMATYKDLKQLLQEGKFRADLFYRIHNTIIQVPALKDHMEDLPDLVEHFIKKFNLKYGKQVASLTPEAMKALGAFSFKGGVRQLRSAVEVGVINSVGYEISLRDLQTFFAAATPDKQEGKKPASIEVDWAADYKTFKKQELWNLEREYLKRHLDGHDWKVAKTAKAIGLSNYTYLNELIRRFNLTRKEKPGWEPGVAG